MNEADKFALVPRPPGALEKVQPGAKRILSGMVRETLSLAHQNKKDAEEIFQRGEKLYKSRNYVEAARCFREAAELNHAKAQLSLAFSYQSSWTGLPENPDEAFKWCYKAVMQGLLGAHWVLGNFYENGIGVKVDVSEAVEWYRKAAEQGDRHGQTALARCYEKGIGVEQNVMEAAKWYRKAAEQGHASAQCELARCYEKGIGLHRDDIEVANWYRKAAEREEETFTGFEGRSGLARCYRRGIGVQRNDAEAVKILLKLSEQGHFPAVTTLGYIYKSGGVGVQRDVTEALKWWRKASEKDFFDAHSELGDCYNPEYGWLGTPKDVSEAYKYYILSSGFAYNQLSKIKAKMTPVEIEEGERRVQAYRRTHPHREDDDE